jgi:peptidoglycan/LPS O-acetylase OafA/YrhL
LRGHLPALDGIRGVAILLVVWYHSLLGVPAASEPGPVDLAYQRLRTAGWTGVDLFFVLSGFLITGILIDAKGRARYFRTFYIRRTLRIFPIYYAFLAVAIGLAALLRHAGGSWQTLWENQVWLWSYLSNVLIAQEGMDATPGTGHLWSLAIEEQFYLVWPFLVYRSSLATLRRLTLGLLAGALALRALILFGTGAPILTTYVLTPCRIDALAAGALVAVLAREPHGYARLRRWAPAALAAGTLVALAIAAQTHVYSFRQPATRLLGFSATALVSAAVLVWALDPLTRMHSVLRHPALRFFGKYSYAIYLLHFPIALGLGRLAGVPRTLPLVLGSRLAFEVPWFLLVLGASTLAARLTWVTIEAPCLALKERWAPS